jgi:hypothetical protein
MEEWKGLAIELWPSHLRHPRRLPQELTVQQAQNFYTRFRIPHTPPEKVPQSI